MQTHVDQFFLHLSFVCIIVVKTNTVSKKIELVFAFYTGLTTICTIAIISHARECHCRRFTWSPRIFIDSIYTIHIDRANIFDSSSCRLSRAKPSRLVFGLMNWIEISMNLCVCVYVCEWNGNKDQIQKDMPRNGFIVSNVHQDIKCANSHAHSRIEWLRCSR